MDNYLLVGSEALSEEFNDLAQFYSDFHKDVYGTRPRHMALCACDYPDHASLEEAMSHLRRLVAGLEAYAPTVWAEEEEERQRAVSRFEEAIQQNLDYGAYSRADAVRWVCDAVGVENAPGQDGWEHLEYLKNIPFGYIQKSLQP